jgi:hypothetical protein
MVPVLGDYVQRVPEAKRVSITVHCSLWLFGFSLVMMSSIAAVYVSAWLLMCGDVEANPGPPPYFDCHYDDQAGWQTDWQTDWLQEIWKYVGEVERTAMDSVKKSL